MSGGAPVIILKEPVPSDTNVKEDARIAIIFFDSDGDIDLSTVDVTINGTPVVVGSAVTGAGYIGSISVAAGRVIVELVNTSGWGFDTRVLITAAAEDSAAQRVQETWSWTTRSNPVCYTGTAPLPIETRLITPLTRYLDLDIVRQTLLDNALTTRSVTDADLRAARVVYQLGYSTEINTVLNPYLVRNDEALAVTVCERNATLKIDAALDRVKSRIEQGIISIRTSGALPEEYRLSFESYLASTQYSYRVSLAANLVLLAHALEANA